MNGNFENAITISNEINCVIKNVKGSEIKNFVNVLSNYTGLEKRVFLAGAGRSLLMIKTFAMRLMHLGFSSFVVGETNTPAISKNDLLIIGSGSGETKGLLMMVEKAKTIGCEIILFTTNSDSSIAKLANFVTIIPVNELDASIQPGGSIFEQSLLVVLDALIIEFVLKRNLLKDKNIDEIIMENHANLE